MIFVTTSTLALAKKALGEKAFQVKPDKIIELLAVDPAVSEMDGVILMPKDIAGRNKVRFQTAIENRHKGVRVIFLCQKDSDASLVSEDCIIKVTKKLSPEIITDVVNSAMQSIDNISTSGQHVVSRDSYEPSIHSTSPSHTPIVEEVEPAESSDTGSDALVQDVDGFWYFEEDGERVYVDPDTLEPLPLDPFTKKPIKAGEQSAPLSAPISRESEAPEAPANPQPGYLQPTADDYMERLANTRDWELMKESLERDSLYKKLLEENSQFVGCVNMLDTLDVRIKSIFYDKGFTTQEKFEKIRDLGIERTRNTAVKNDIVSAKVVEIINIVGTAAVRTVEERVATIRSELNQMSAGTIGMIEGFEHELYIKIDDRVKLEFEVLNMIKDIINLFKAMDLTVTESIRELDSKLPSGNEYINEMLGFSRSVFTPENAAAVANRMISALQSNRVQLSQCETMTRSLIDLLFLLSEKDVEVIEYQQKVIAMLKAHRVEDVVIVDTVLKKALRVYIGDEGSGKTATTLTYCGILSRRHNTLLLDFTGEHKLQNYGADVMPLTEFMAERVERPLMMVEGDVSDPEYLMEVVRELKMRLNFYPFINVLINDAQGSILDQLSPEALSVHYIVGNTRASIDTMKHVIGNHNATNIARKLILVDSPLDVLSMVDKLAVDPTIVKVISVPHISTMQSCALREDLPYDHEDVRAVFEEAFR